MIAGRCMGCGQFISAHADSYVQAGNRISHIKEKCLTKLFDKIKYNCPNLNFFEKNQSSAMDLYVVNELTVQEDYETRED